MSPLHTLARLWLRLLCLLRSTRSGMGALALLCNPRSAQGAFYRQLPEAPRVLARAFLSNAPAFASFYKPLLAIWLCLSLALALALSGELYLAAPHRIVAPPWPQRALSGQIQPEAFIAHLAEPSLRNTNWTRNALRSPRSGSHFALPATRTSLRFLRQFPEFISPPWSPARAAALYLSPASASFLRAQASAERAFESPLSGMPAPARSAALQSVGLFLADFAGSCVQLEITTAAICFFILSIIVMTHLSHALCAARNELEGLSYQRRSAFERALMTDELAQAPAAPSASKRL